MDKKFAFQIIGLLIVTFTAMALTFRPSFFPSSSLTQRQSSAIPAIILSKLKITDESQTNQKAEIQIEIADTKEKRSKGLSYRDSLPPDYGMLFVLENLSKPTFWMKGMKIPLDFIWIRDDSIVDLLENVPPPEEGQKDDTLPHYSPVSQVNRVLEVNAGYIAAHGIKIGDRIKIDQNSE